MPRAARVLLALLIIPLLDALFLVFVALRIGGVLTVALVVLTALLGLAFVRAEGRHTLRRIQAAVAEGRQPTDELMDGALLLVAGAFLLTPGLVTDAIGFLLVFPVTRYPIRVALKRYVVVPALDEQTDGFVTGGVYVGGFPGGDGGTAGDAGRPGGAGDAYDLDADEYDVEFDDESEGNG